MRMQEGKQYFVNRITFVGNTTTRDNVDPARDAAGRGRRVQHRGAEVQRQAAEPARVLQAARRADGRSTVDKTPGADNKVDVTLKLEEQNRNQLTFGAGVSQYEGFFGQLVVPDGELHGPRRDASRCRCRPGSRAQNYQLAFTEPFLFDRPITGGHRPVQARDPVHRPVHADVDGRQHRRSGSRCADFTRMFINYSYEQRHG